MLISVIGTGGYKPTTYQFGGKQAESSPYVIKAIKELFSPDKIFVLMTKEAEEKHKSDLEQVCEFEMIPIQTGKNERELWDMFQAVAEKVPENETLIIDVTHGFRSQPMLLLAIAVYLQVMKNVKIAHILYGAYDAKDDNGVSPIFDLKPFLDLISWSFATDNFLKKGDATLLSELLSNIHNQAHKSKNDYSPKGLKGIGKTLAKLSEAFAVVRPQEVLELASQLPKKIKQTYSDIDNLSEAKPFKSLLDKITEKFDKFSFNGSFFSEEGMRAQAKIIKFCLDTEQYQQAVTLSRELIVTKACAILNFDMIKNRGEAEKQLNDAAINENHFLQMTEQSKEFVSIWRNLVEIRNDINHAGMRKKTIPAKSLIEQIKKLCGEVVELVSVPTTPNL
ncbi:MAG: TIGR02221 family CRISPR-associated protein [Chitinophagales bacterium]|nr:TIGR02221 family CRISPR-associated protein [Chitinophagales bacterium]